jgi:hypothetical protein
MGGGNHSTAVAFTVESTGNRCGHDPAHPRFFSPPARHAARPKIIQRIITAIRGYYHSPSATLPGLNAANESERQQRSERREACCAILGAILHYTDLVTLRVGIPQADGSMAGLTMETLAKLSGLAHVDDSGAVVCIRRAERAVADLKAAGILTVHALCERLEDATYRGTAAIRTVSKHLFAALGLGGWLEHERRRAKERAEAKARKRQGKQLANVRLAVSALDQQRQAKPAPEAPAERRNEPTSAAEFFAAMKGKFGGTGPPS